MDKDKLVVFLLLISNKVSLSAKTVEHKEENKDLPLRLQEAYLPQKVLNHILIK